MTSRKQRSERTRPGAERISLCMMVRDEGALLPGCLQAAQGVWDELVVVDTGSTDDTLAVARRFGARVVPFTWCDDFAAGRNAGLDAATGDWVLVLDADELLSPGAKAQLRALAQDAGAGAATLLMVNQQPHGHRRQSRLLRFFRRDPLIRFLHRIHEDVSMPVAACLERTGQRLVALGGTVLHLGYARERMLARGKKERDRRLLERALAEHPDDLYAWLKLLEQARFWRDGELAVRASASAAAAMARADPQALASLHFGGELAAAVAAASPGGDEERLQVLDAWVGRVRPSAPLHLLLGELREVLGDAAGARAAYLDALGCGQAEGDLQLATVRPLLGLARLAIAAGDLDEAWARVQQALALDTGDLEALTAAMVLASARGGEPAVDELVRRHGGRPELHAALGEAALLQGQTQRAVLELEEASRHTPDSRVHLRLAQALLADGRLAAARALAQRLAPALPEAALGVLVCDLIAGVGSALEVPLGQREADAALRDWVGVLRQQRAGSLLARLRAVAPAVEAYFPWLPALVRAGPEAR